jgi:hypothetical protein
MNKVYGYTTCDDCGAIAPRMRIEAGMHICDVGGMVARLDGIEQALGSWLADPGVRRRTEWYRYLAARA